MYSGPARGKAGLVARTESRSFGSLLRRYRMAAYLTQEQLAERAGLSVRGISDLERGVNRAPYLATVARLIEALTLSEEEGRALEAATSRLRGPATASFEPRPARLPAQPTSLVGRERDEAAAVHLFRWEGRRLLTLTGAGDVGKTRLALQVAATMAADFADGVVFVPPASGPCPVAELLRYPCVALFLQRARLVKPAFQITEENARAVAQICGRVDGLPLGIELAASRLRILSPQALLARLERRLQVLAGGTVEVAPRQQTLRNTLAWSHDLLDGAEQTLFRRLSVFAGGCSAEEVEAVCVSGDERELDVFEGLTSLVDKSLLVSEEQEADDQRLHMLDTTGEFARECLEASGEAEMMLRRHAMYYLTLAERAEPELRGRDQGIWLTRLDRAHDNIRAVLQWTMDSGDVEAGMRLAGALWWFWYARGYLSEGRHWLDLLLSRDAQNQRVTPAVRAKALRACGALATEQGDYAPAVTLAEESLGLFQELGDRLSVGTLRTVLGNIAKYQTDFARARCLYTDALALFRELGDKRNISVSLNNLGNLAKEQGDYGRAMSIYEESLVLKRELGDPRGIAIVLSNIGTMAHAQGDDRRAAAAGEESVALLRELEDKDLASALDTLARAVLAQRDDQRAMELYREGLRVSWSAGELQLVAFCLEGVGRVASAQGNMRKAVQLYGAGVALHERIGAPLSPAEEAQDASYFDVARQTLGATEFAATWTHGQAMLLERAVACALDDTPHSTQNPRGE